MEIAELLFWVWVITWITGILIMIQIKIRQRMRHPFDPFRSIEDGLSPGELRRARAAVILFLAGFMSLLAAMVVG